MSRPQAVWQVEESDETVSLELASALGLSPIVARILYNRGLHSVEEAERFLSCDLAELHDPYLLKDMDSAVKEIDRALISGDRILVYGDYDVDGVTSTVLLLDALNFLGCEAGFYIPDRLEEGYGLNREALTKAASQGYKLIISVDCGISAREEAAYAAEMGLKLVITDHHEPPPDLPCAQAVIDPKRPDCAYPFKDLAGVGVAFKLVQALFSLRGIPGREMDLIDLVTLGTIADLVPLRGENRILVKHGLSQLNSNPRLGLKSLAEVAGLNGRVIGPGQVAFALAPRINATGRVGDAAIAVRLLRSQDPLRAREMAVYLDAENRTRQEIEAEVLAEALEMLREFHPAKDKVIVLAKEGWHPGVLGIAASRLVERYYRPAIMIALEGGEGKGSGRSIAGFDLYRALSGCSESLLRFGGHKQAAGLSISAGRVDSLRQELNRLAALEDADIYLPRLRLDGRVELSQVNQGLVEEIRRLEPFGIGNPSPVLLGLGLTLQEAREVGKEGGHLKVRVQEGSTSKDGIGFNLGGLLGGLRPGQMVDAVFSPEINEYNGRTSVQLQLKDIRTGKIITAASKLPPAEWNLSPVELEALQTLTRGGSASLRSGENLSLPVIAALSMALQTGLTSIIIYPHPLLADRMARINKDLIAGYGFQAEAQSTTAYSTGWDKADILFASREFLLQDRAKLEGITGRAGLLVADSLAEYAAAAEEIGIPVLYTFTSPGAVRAHGPGRERLARMYRAMRDMTRTGGELGPEQYESLAHRLGESQEFIWVGMEIFEELDIVKRKNNESKRIFTFQAPSKKLNLQDSLWFTEGQLLASEFAGMSMTRGG